MAKKVAVPNPSAPDYSPLFNWGVKITNLSELFLIAGHGAVDAEGTVHHPGDAVGQTRFILDQLDSYLKDNGYGRDDIIRVEFTMTKDVPPEAYDEIFGLFGEFFGPMKVKPAAGTLRVIEALAIPGMIVEYEFWCAK